MFLYLLFFLSGLSGLIYQVAWVRVFGRVFGNTVYSASIVVAVFMLGLGVGGYIVGVWADRRYAKQPESLLRAYACAELAIACLGAGIATLLPYLDRISALISSYSRDVNGWYVLSASSYLLRGSIALVLLTPVTIVMGGTLTLLIRHVSRGALEIGARRTALIYGANTVGAALGCFLTDFTLVPAAGLKAAQLLAVSMNLVAAAGAFLLARRSRTRPPVTVVRKRAVVAGAASAVPSRSSSARLELAFTGLALALTGFAAMGMEILWLRHFSLLLGEFRAVFALLLTVILIGIGAGAFVGGFLHRRTAQPAHWLMAAQGLFVASTLAGLARADVHAIHAAARGLDSVLTAEPAWARSLAELWFNAKPILLEVGAPALLMGVAFPLGNAMVQRAEQSVARRAGALYLFNTVGSVCGSVVAGFGLLPALGIQRSATLLCVAAWLAILPLHFVATRSVAAKPLRPRLVTAPLVASSLAAGIALVLWLLLPSDYVIQRAQALPANERLLALSEGVTEVIAVTDAPGTGRTLLTNGHPMAGTAPLGQRYMRALAHIPLLLLDQPESVLVIGFGVGNTAHAATLHPSVRRVDVADLSRHVLAHAGYFSEANADVLNDRRVSVYVNDGRQHLLMQPAAAAYDLITLEPPPIAQAGVGALYSREFYELARSRLKPGGYISQWLPAYQVPAAATLAMVRAFVDVFPQAVLLSGAKADLLLVGTKGAAAEIDPDLLAAALSRAPAAQRDLQRFDLGGVREIVGTFIGSARSLADATRDSAPVTDDRPIQEYSVRSLVNAGRRVATPSASLLDLGQIPAWCPRCFVDGKPVPLVAGIDTYFALLDQFYSAPAEGGEAARYGARVIDGSAYLGAIVPESADVHDILGMAMADRGQGDRAIAEFREALRINPDSAAAHWHLGNALASRGQEGGVDHLRRSVALRPDNSRARYDLATTLFELGQYDEAMSHFRAALPSMPNAALAYNTLGVDLVSRGKLGDAIDQFREAIRLRPTYVEAYNNLGTALAFQGRREEAIAEFQRALVLQPEYAEARRNLSIVQRTAVPLTFEVAGGSLSRRRQPPVRQ